MRPSLSMSSLNEGTPRHVLGRPIRHVRQAASASTADSIPFAPPFTNLNGFWTDAAEECSGEAISTPQRFGSPGRKASVVSQNAFLTLPPHLHHLLRAPEFVDVLPTRPAQDSFEQPFASPSARQAAELTLLLADRLEENSLADPLQTPHPAKRPRPHPFAQVPRLDVARADRISPPETLGCESTPRSMSSDMPVFEDFSNLFWKPNATRSPSPTPRAARPAPNPLQQQPWSATSFGHLYLDGSYQSNGKAASREPTQPNNSSHESFLIFDRDEPDGNGISRGCVSPASFIDLDYDFHPQRFALKRASLLSEEQRPKLRADDSRSSTRSRLEHLSIDSRFFLSPLQPTASPYLSSDVSRNSTLNGRLEDFPAPPSFVPSIFSETCSDRLSPTKAESVKLNKFNGGGEGKQRVLGSTDSRLEGGRPADFGGIARRSTGSAESAWFADSSESE